MQTTKCVLYAIGEGEVWVEYPIFLQGAFAVLSTEGSICDPRTVWKAGGEAEDHRGAQLWACTTKNDACVCVLIADRVMPLEPLKNMCAMIDMPAITKRIIDDELLF